MGERHRSLDHYALLGVARDAGPGAVRAAFRAQARRWHPDFNPGDREAEQRMQALNVAFETLSCPLRRREYDRQLGVARTSRPITPADRADAWARARAAREAKARWEAAQPRVRRTSVNPDTLGPALTAITVGCVSLALFWHALPGPRPQPRLLAEALGLKEPRRTALASYVAAPPSTEPRTRVVISPPASRALAGPGAPVPAAGATDAPAPGTAAGAASVPSEPVRASLAELAESARRGEAAALAWEPRPPTTAPDFGLGARGGEDVTALGSQAEALGAWRAAALADQEARRLMLDAARERAEADRRLAALDAELEAMRATRRAAAAAAARVAETPAPEATPPLAPADSEPPPAGQSAAQPPAG